MKATLMSVSRLFAVLSFVLCCLFFSLVALSGSTQFVIYATEQASKLVPGLTFDQVEGSLKETLTFSLYYEDESINLSAQQVALETRGQCLWSLTLCLQQLSIEALTLGIKPSATTNADAQKKPNTLPTVALPISLRIEQASIKQLEVFENKSTLHQLNDVSLSARWLGYSIDIKRLNAHDIYCSWTLSGNIRLKGFYPLYADAACTPTDFPQEKAIAKIQGDLSKLKASVHTQGTIKTRLDLNTNVLDSRLPLDFKIQLEAPTTAPIEEAIVLNSAIIEGKGDLSQLTLHAKAQLTSLRLNKEIAASFEGNLSPTQLTAKILTIKLPQGAVKAAGVLSFQDHLAWSGHVHLEHPNLAEWVPELQGSLNGSLSTHGTYQQEKLLATVEFEDFGGILFDESWQAKGSAQWNNDQLNISGIEFIQASNRLSVEGSWAPTGISQLNADIMIHDLEQLLPDIKGSAQGTLTLQGHWQQPYLKTDVSISDFYYDTLHFKHLKSQVSWSPEEQHANILSAEVQGFALSEHYIGDGIFTGMGNPIDHTIKLQWKDNYSQTLTLECDGAFASSSLPALMKHWNGRCNTLTLKQGLSEPPQTWVLNESFNVDLENLRAISITPFCLSHDDSTFCNGDIASFNEQGIFSAKLSGDNMKFEWFNAWLPASARLYGSTDLDASVSNASGKLAISASALSEDLSLNLIQSPTKTLIIPYHKASVQLNSIGSDLTSQWTLASDQSGALNGRLSTKANVLSGVVNVSQIDIEPITQLFLSDSDDAITGVINGKIMLSGTTDAPTAKGQLTVSAGEIRSSVLPLPIQAINMDVDINQQRADFNGHFSIADQTGKTFGFFEWKDENWQSELQFQASEIPFQPEDGVLIYLSPEIKFHATPSHLALTGEVYIPKARIYLKSLPAQAAGISPDARVYDGAQYQQESMIVSSDLKLLLGDDIRFKGFGLETRIAGQLQVQQKPSELLRAKGIVRLIEGTYQAYGQSLVIREGDLIFIDDIENPQLRLSAIRDRVQDNVEVGIRVTGRAKNPSLALFSNPDMPQQAKLHYLITGRAPNTEDPTDSSQAATEAAIALALSSNEGLTRKAGDKLGIDDLTITTGSTENRSEVSLSGYITPNLMVRYGIGMFEAVNSITLNYRIKKNLYFEIISGRSNAFDVLWTFERN